MLSIFNAYIEYDLESKMYIGIVPSIKGAHTQASTLDELNKNLQEVILLCLEEGEKINNILKSKFIGIQQVEVEL